MRHDFNGAAGPILGCSRLLRNDAGRSTILEMTMAGKCIKPDCECLDYYEADDPYGKPDATTKPGAECGRLDTIVIKSVTYNIGDPRKLKHKRCNILEIIVSAIMSSHVCQICRRKEIWSVSGWLQIDDPVYKDKTGCSVVCNECAALNPKVFG